MFMIGILIDNTLVTPKYGWSDGFATSTGSTYVGRFPTGLGKPSMLPN